MKKFHCVYEMMPLIYALVDAANGDVCLAETYIIQGCSFKVDLFKRNLA